MAETEKSMSPAPPADPATESGQEPFLSRGSRLKEEARQAPPQKPPQPAADPKAPAPELPPLEELTFDSDYRAFFHPKVSEDVRRAALKKLFGDPRFNVMDGLDVYIDDYSKSEPIPPAMLASLKQARKILEWAKEDEEARLQARREAVRAGGSQAGQGAPAALESPSSDLLPQASVSQEPEVLPAAAEQPADRDIHRN